MEFSFKELAKASNNFAPDSKIDEGGFTKVYMGRLPDGREVAIKHYPVQAKEEFMREITVLSPIRYKHIVPLYGYCSVLVEKRRHLLRPFQKEKEDKKLLLVFFFLRTHAHFI